MWNNGNLGSVYTTQEELENGGFTLKTHQMISVRTTPEELEKRNNHRSFWIRVFVVEENPDWEIT